MNDVIFEAVNISKKIDGYLILENITFQIEEFSALAIRGKNGSGKSTLLKILAGIYEPTSGKIIRHNKKIAYVPEHFPVNLRFKLKEYLFLIASVYGFSKSQSKSMLTEYIQMFELEPFLNTPLKQCSKGTKQKVNLIQALLMKPDILLLDEPLTGLDTASQHTLIQIIEKLFKKVTIIFTTHEELMIEKLANQILDVETGEISLNTKQRKRFIKILFNDKEIFKEMDLLNARYKGSTAYLTVDASLSDQLLIELLNKKCTVLEVREMREV